MKKSSFLLIVMALIALAATAKVITARLATPDEIEGYKIFLLSKPVDDYEKVGYVKVKMSWSGKPDELLHQTVKKAQDQFPTGDAIIFENIDMDKAMVIKFK